MSTGYNLPPREHAAFAVSSRLISCLVTESLLRAFYVDTPGDVKGTAGLLVVLSTTTSIISEEPDISRALRPDDIFAIVPLHHAPVFKGTPATRTRHGRVVGLVDPLDMVPEIYVVVEVAGESVRDTFSDLVHASLAPPPWDLGKDTKIKKCTDPLALWAKFVGDMLLSESLSTAIADELQSSMDWQRLSYENPPKGLSLTSAPLEWEQSIVAGHPTHPMHRARMCTTAPAEYDWYHPQIRFARVPEEDLDTQGAFKSLSRALVTKAAGLSGTAVPADIPGTLVMPFHEMQLPTIREKFKNVEILEPSIAATAQSSIRTVLIPAMGNLALKVSVNMKISSALRTISHWTADFGPRFSRDIVPNLHIDHKVLFIETEPSSAVYRGVENAVRKHFTAIFREEFQPKEGESIAVVAALLESGHRGAPVGVSAVEHVFGLDTETKRTKFLDDYLRLVCDAFIPPTLYDGVVFEAHAQNCLLRFNKKTGELLGFVVRDLGGLRIHPATMNASLGTNFQFLPGHCVVTETVEETYPKFYHTLIHNHLQRLIRLLGLHYNGVGWELLRKHLRRVIPRDHGLWKAWMETDVVAGKCLLRMRLQSVHDKMVFSPIPNMLQYRGEAASNDKETLVIDAVLPGMETKTGGGGGKWTIAMVLPRLLSRWI
ncbi:C2 domain-containing protein [Mycena chlorophos]|uniref:C2 domain-containing protein n=1 Tax=Mycena chlorophos TaxID=658473 RepID=A0A8H6TI10_MYCCL|nr:C2 domain-containing protein [Mycena chlorophos]